MLNQDSIHNEIKYRKVESQDIESICAIYNSHIDLGGSTFEKDYWQASTLEKQIINNQDDFWFVAQLTDKIIGWSAARRYSDRFGYRLTREFAIYFAAEYTGKGYAAKLLEMTERACRLAGIHHLVSRVIANNEKSIRFHHRFGYETVGTQREIGYLNDQWLDVAILQKIL